MKKFITAIALGIVALTGNAFAETQSVDALVAKLPEAHTTSLRRTAVIVEARANSAFYDSLKAGGFKLEDVELTPAQVVSLAFTRGDYEAFDAKEAAKFLSLPSYKSYVAAKVQALGTDAVAAYDWLQRQRLLVVEAGPKDAAEKGEFLAVIADQVIEQDKAKAKVSQ